MTDTCLVTRAGADPVLNEDTGNYEAADPATVYAGKCRVRSPQSQAMTRSGGEQYQIINRVAVWLPVGGSGFTTGDLVTITASPFNPQLSGARYVVRSVDDQSHASSLRLECEET